MRNPLSTFVVSTLAGLLVVVVLLLSRPQSDGPPQSVGPQTPRSESESKQDQPTVSLAPLTTLAASTTTTSSPNISTSAPTTPPATTTETPTTLAHAPTPSPPPLVTAAATNVTSSGPTPAPTEVDTPAPIVGPLKTSNACWQSLVRSRGSSPIRIATVGDSLSTESHGNAYKKRFGQPAYTRMMAKAMNINHEIRLFAYVGHTALGVLERTPEDMRIARVQIIGDVTEPPPFEACFVLVGTNDVLADRDVDKFLEGVRGLTKLCEQYARVTVLQAIPPYRCVAGFIDRFKAEAFRLEANGCLAALVRHDSLRLKGLPVNGTNVTCPSGRVVEALRHHVEDQPPRPRMCVQNWLPTSEDWAFPMPADVHEPTDDIFLHAEAAAARTKLEPEVMHRYFQDCVHPSTTGKSTLALNLLRFFDAGGMTLLPGGH